MCDGLTEEELLSRKFMRIAVDGCTGVVVETTPMWAYTIGLKQSFDHPEVVITGRLAEHLLGHAVGQVRDGGRFDVTSPALEVCDCGPVRFGPVHPSEWERGRFDEWLKYYAWVGGEAPAREALQLLWSDRQGRFPPDPDFCCAPALECQPLLDGVPRHNVNTGSNREQRRRAKYGHGKRSRGQP
jgi:hypothetical protein